MRLAHVADVHLGFRRYYATTAQLRNQREQDVSDAWRHAVDGIIARQVDLVLIAGDFFDSPTPSNHADNDAVVGLTRIRKALPKTLIVIAEGNHEASIQNSTLASTGSPLAALASISGVRIVHRVERIALPALNAHVLCVPETFVHRVKFEPSAAPGTHLLVAHGKFSATLYRLPDAECIDPTAISDQFHYAALGDFHVPAQVGPNAFYSGALEGVSSNPWGEIGTPYGWNEFDTETGVLTRHVVPTRPHIDLAPISGDDVGSKALSMRILEQLAAQPIEGAIVRQVVTGVPMTVSKGLDFRGIKRAASPALFFSLDQRRPTVTNRGRVLMPGADLVDDGPDWLDEWNRDEPLPQADDFSYADAIARGDIPLLDPNADPYSLNASPRRSAAA